MIKKKNAHVKDFGGDGEVIVLLHGFLASSKYWIKLQPYLSDAGYRVIAIDLLGFGDAPKPNDAAYDYKEHVSYIHSIIAQYDIDKPFVMIGHSMGALIAARYDKVFPKAISSLILLHPPLYKTPKEARATLRSTGLFYRFLLDSRYRRLGWIVIKTFIYHRIGKHTIKSREMSLQNVIEQAEALDDLTHTTTKSMLVVGLRDRAEYMNNLPGSNLSSSIKVIIEDVTHHSPTEEPRLIQDKILQFIK